MAINPGLVGTLLDDTAARTGSPLLTSPPSYLAGDCHGVFDGVVGLPEAATPAECVEALRSQVDEAIAAGGPPADLECSLAHVVATIG